MRIGIEFEVAAPDAVERRQICGDQTGDQKGKDDTGSTPVLFSFRHHNVKNAAVQPAARRLEGQPSDPGSLCLRFFWTATSALRFVGLDLGSDLAER